jgi:hypothetical protein
VARSCLINLTLYGNPTTHFSRAKNNFDKCGKMLFLNVGYENENHVCKNAEARAGQWLDGHLPARLPSFWHRGNEILITHKEFSKPAIAKGSRGFFAF